jgi:DNA-binding LacI/PurR family transcriptional regulator
VDRALHDRPGISAATKARVLEMAERHGYRPHPAARELLTGERRTIGAVVPAGGSVFFMDLMNVIRAELAPAGYRFFITQVNDQGEFERGLQEFAAFRARAIVAVPPRELTAINASLVGSTDVAVLINPCEGDRVTNFVPDETETGRIAARYLIERGHRRLLHLRPLRDSAAIRARAVGFSEVIEARGLPTIVRTLEDGLARTVREQEATAIFCHNDWLALSAMRTLSQAGLRVPEDLSVLGVDDSPTFVSLCPDITTLHYPAESIAAAIKAWLDGLPASPIANVHVVERRTVTSLTDD